MSDNNNNENNKNEEQKEELKKLFNEIKENGNLNEEDLEELKKSLESLMSGNESVGSLIIKLIKRVLLCFISLYVISTAVLGLLIHSVAIENIYYLPLVSLGISVLFTIFKLLPFLNKKIFIYVIPYVTTMIICCLLNYKLNVFDFDIVWVVYIILIEIIYFVFTLCRMRRKFSFLRR